MTFLLVLAAGTAPVVAAVAPVPVFAPVDLSAPLSPHAPMRVAPALLPSLPASLAAAQPVDRNASPRWSVR